jgi:ABC-type antimicrobial peptide transport system permease subunit
VYRALGALKKDLRKIFFIEALILTSMTSLWGYLLTNVLLIRLQGMTSEFTDVVRVTPLSFVVGIAIIFTVNILSGIIPITTLLNRTPAEIISKYDF